MKYKLNLLVLMSIFIVMGLASAEFGYDSPTIGTFKQGEPINLLQTCSNCTYVNISYVQAPNSTIILSNKLMTKSAASYNYTLPAQPVSGNYIVCGLGNLNGVPTSWCYNFEVTPSGDILESSEAPVIFIVIGIEILFGLFFFGLGYKSNGLTGQIIFFGLSAIMLIVGLLYSLVVAEQIIPTQLILIDGLATLWSVIKILIGIALILLILFVLLNVYWSWNKKRGFED